jgi:hypothetical protein
MHLPCYSVKNSGKFGDELRGSGIRMTDVRLSQEPSRHSILYLVGVVNSHRRHYKLSCFLNGFFNAAVMVFTGSYHLSHSKNRRDTFKFEIHSRQEI